MAQTPVYSLNVVGYMTIPLTNQYTLVANQLDSDGNMTNNNLGAIFGNPPRIPSSTTVLTYDASHGYWQSTWSGTKWSGNAANSNSVNVGLQMGKGFFVQLASAPYNTNVTLVGSVVQGTNLTTLGAGYQVLSATTPIAGYITTNLGFVPVSSDVVLQYHNGFSSKTWSGTKWSGTIAPFLNAGEATFIYSLGAHPAWTNNFTVQ
jgi:hypothetical protein